MGSPLAPGDGSPSPQAAGAGLDRDGASRESAANARACWQPMSRMLSCQRVAGQMCTCPQTGWRVIRLPPQQQREERWQPPASGP
eukprot:4959000-Prymnesium_polylepis.2